MPIEAKGGIANVRMDQKGVLYQSWFGAYFVKLGQLLSTRPDLVPPTLATELEKLQDTTRN